MSALPGIDLGATGLHVTPVGLGTAALGRPGYINLGHGDDLDDRSVEGMRAHTGTVLDHAYDAGVRHVDMARSYGRAEEFVASWLAGRDVEVTLSSKWGYTYTADWQVDADEHEVKEHSREVLARQLGETRGHLGDRLDLYQVHSATLDSGLLDDPALLDDLTALAEDVVVGLSLSGPGQAATLDRALALAEQGRAPFRCVQATWNVLEPSVGPALARAADAGWGVIVKEGVANGRLTPRGDPPHLLADAAEQLGVGVDAVALAAALAQPFVDVVLSGATTAAQLDSNLDAVELALPDALLARLGALAEEPDAYWSRRGDLAWS